jgi:predicted molibdopterin-dependent oxidoreductase YjgC
VRVTSAPEAPVNGMRLCVKGRYGYDYVHHPDRLTRPLVRAQWLDPAQLEQRIANGEWRMANGERQMADSQWQIADGKKRRRTSHQPSAISHKQSAWVEVDWDTALDVVAQKFADIKRESGGSALAVLTSAKCTNEENYLVNKLTRQVLGTNSIDHCARL